MFVAKTIVAEDSIPSYILHIPDTISYKENINNPKNKLYKRPIFISANYVGGTVLKSSESLKENTTNVFPYAQYTNFKFGFSSQKKNWKDAAYGMPYYGLGIGFYNFQYKNLGNPISVYLLQGATIKSFSPTFRLKYEWNFGTSFNWKVYDPLTNPDNKNVGAKVNIYFAANIFMLKEISKHFDLELGVVYNHNSNGSTKVPNSGINTVGGFVGLKYHFNRDHILNYNDPDLLPPVYENSRLISDIAIHPSWRQRQKPITKTGLSTEYINHNFFVLNASYALLYMPNYRYRYGLGVDIFYDESSDFTAKKIGQKADGLDIAYISYGKVKDRFAVGLSARGDIVMPIYTVFFQLGYNIIHGNNDDSRFYQAFGVKVPFWKNLYGSFSIRARKFSKSEYFLLGLGYTFDHRPFLSKKK